MSTHSQQLTHIWQDWAGRCVHSNYTGISVINISLMQQWGRPWESCHCAWWRRTGAQQDGRWARIAARKGQERILLHWLEWRHHSRPHGLLRDNVVPPGSVLTGCPQHVTHDLLTVHAFCFRWTFSFLYFTVGRLRLKGRREHWHLDRHS